MHTQATSQARQSPTPPLQTLRSKGVHKEQRIPLRPTILHSTFFSKLESSLSLAVADTLTELETNGVVEKKEINDSDGRVSFVVPQACFETVFLERLKNNPDSVICTCHTDTPATPICKTATNSLKDVIHETAIGNFNTEKSVELRIPLVHELCKACKSVGSMPYQVLHCRSREEAAGDTPELKEAGKALDMSYAWHLNREDMNIKDIKLSALPPHSSGATYFYRINGSWRMFYIRAQQAKDAVGYRDFELGDVPVQSEKAREKLVELRNVYPRVLYTTIQLKTGHLVPFDG